MKSLGGTSTELSVREMKWTLGLEMDTRPRPQEELEKHLLQGAVGLESGGIRWKRGKEGKVKPPCSAGTEVREDVDAGTVKDTSGFD